MDPRERMNNLPIAVDAAISGRLAHLWTALPARVFSFNPVTKTAVVQSMVIPTWNNPITGQRQIPLPIPLIQDVSVCFPGGGGYHLTFPIVGDPVNGTEGLMLLASRQIDGWFATGSPSVPTDLRMHDLSDGFFIPGVQSQPAAQAGAAVSTSAVQLRNDAGTTYIEITSTQVRIQTNEQCVVAATGMITLTSSTGIQLNAPPNTVTANGNVLG